MSYEATKPLSAGDIKAFKDAAKNTDWNREDYVAIDWRQTFGHAVQLGTRVRLPEGSSPPEYTTFVVVMALGTNDVYRETGAKRFVTTETHYKSERSCSFIRNIANTARVGDELHVRFIIGNDTETMKAASLTLDLCEVSVVRGGKFVATFKQCQVGKVGAWTMADDSYRPENDVERAS